VKTEKRIIILLQFANPEFKTIRTFVLIDEVIKRYSNSEILRFEGSDIPVSLCFTMLLADSAAALKYGKIYNGQGQP
jgi:hypothetical protein